MSYDPDGMHAFPGTYKDAEGYPLVLDKTALYVDACGVGRCGACAWAWASAKGWDYSVNLDYRMARLGFDRVAVTDPEPCSDCGRMCK